MTNEIKTPIEHIPTDEMYGLECMVYFPEPGIYKLTWGWDRAMFTEAADDGTPLINDTSSYSYIYNTNKDKKAVKVFTKCCMLIRQWDRNKKATEYTNTDEPCGELKAWGLEEYTDIDTFALAKFFIPIFMAQQKYLNESAQKENPEFKDPDAWRAELNKEVK